MKYLIILISIFMMVGCSSKEIRYNTLGEKSIITKSSEDVYHDAQSKAWSGYYEALKNPPVIAQIHNTDGTVITINSQIPPPAPIIRQHENQYIKPIAEVAKWVVGGVVIDRGISAVVRGMGDTIVSNSGDGNVIVDKSDSIAGKSSSSVDTTKTTDNTSSVTDNSLIDNSNRSVVDNTDSSNNSDNSVFDTTDDNSVVDNSNHSVVDNTNNTADNTTDNSWVDNTDNSMINPDPLVVVVDPPEPVIVNPVIVQPAVVDPVIVNPNIVDPVIVPPSYPPTP